MSRWGKPTKNKKRRDPRYFLNESVEGEETLKEIINEEIAKQLELDENFLDDAWQGTLKKVGKMTGKNLSRSQKQRARNKAAAAKNKEYWDNPPEPTPEEKAEYQRRRDAEEREYYAAKKRRNRGPRYGGPEKDIETQFHDDERYDSRWGEQDESIDRDKLARIVAEELQKVLKNK